MASGANNEFELKGLSVSKGIAHGEAFVMLNTDFKVPVYEIKPSDKERERERLQTAIIRAREDILKVKAELSESVGEAEAAIFDAHLLVLEDVAILQETFGMLERENFNVEYCYSCAVDKFIGAFEKIDDPFIRERIADLKDVSKRVIDKMLGRSTLNMGILSDPLILVSSDFAPSDFALVDKSKILAIITEKGSQTSHTAILSRSLGIPCIVGVEGVAEKVSTGQFLLVDGYNGNIVANPTENTLRHYTELESVHREVQKLFDSALPMPSSTLDGEQFELFINISGAADIPQAMENYAGVGLFRTENFFLDMGAFPDEDAQYEAYAAAVKAAKGKPVVIRTLDLGGDKNLSLMKMVNKEENPFMGYRAIRFCLDHKDCFKQQLRAILRAGALGPVKILLPMICSIREVERARGMIEEAEEDLRKEGKAFDSNIQVGSMIEVPSAALTIDIIAKASDFISIGTNDLIQYILAVDRVNDMVAHLYEPTHPAVIRIIDHVVRRAQQAGIPVSVCGELAADPTFCSLLLGMGIRQFSMSAKSVGEIKYLLRKISLKQAVDLRNDVMALTRSRHVISRLRSFHYEIMQSK